MNKIAKKKKEKRERELFQPTKAAPPRDGRGGSRTLGNRVRRIVGGAETRIGRLATTRKEDEAKEKRAESKKRERDTEEVRARAGKETERNKTSRGVAAALSGG